MVLHVSYLFNVSIFLRIIFLHPLGMDWGPAECFWGDEALSWGPQSPFFSTLRPEAQAGGVPDQPVPHLPHQGWTHQHGGPGGARNGW